MSTQAPASPQFHRLTDLGWTGLTPGAWKKIVQERRIPSYKAGGSVVLVARADVMLYLLRGHRPYQPRRPKKKQSALAVVKPIRERQVSSEQAEP